MDNSNVLYEVRQILRRCQTSTLHSFRDGKRSHQPAEPAIRRVLGKQPLDLDFSRHEEFSRLVKSSSPVEIITTLRMPRRFYRMLAPGLLETLLLRLPRLVSLEIEQWRPVDEGHFGTMESTYTRILKTDYPKH